MEEIKEIINKCSQEFKFSITKIILFGSRARGQYNENSDYDILVLLNEDVPDELKIKLSCIITRELSDKWINADIIVKSAKEIKQYENCIGSIVRIALKEGVLI